MTTTWCSHAVYGDFRIRTELLDPPRYAAFRWLPQETDDVPSDATTLVEFRIEDRAGGVRLSVVESGFSTLSDDRSVWLDAREENVEGWQTELGAARDHLDPVAVTRSVNLPLPPEQVWPLLIDGDLLARWYAFGGAAVDATPGGAGRAALGGARDLPRPRARRRTARDVLVPPRRRARRRRRRTAARPS